MAGMVESFKRDQAEVNWRELKIHLQRDAIITLAADLDLISVAVAVAEDDSHKIEAWIATGSLGKPSETQLKGWEQDQEKKFQMLIVQPYILVQEIADAG